MKSRKDYKILTLIEQHVSCPGVSTQNANIIPNCEGIQEMAPAGSAQESFQSFESQTTDKSQYFPFVDLISRRST